MAKYMRMSAALGVFLTLAAPAFAEGETAATVVATVNGKDITLGQVIALKENLPADFQSLEDQVLFDAVVEQLIQQELLAQTVTERSTRDEANLANDEMNYLAGAAMQKIIAAGVTDEAIASTYDELMKDVAPVKEFRASHILVEDETLANELKAELDKGGDFAEIAKKNSKDPGSGAAGGDLGWFDPAQMVKPFADAVIAAEPGKVTAPVKSDFGWHIILVNESREVKRPTLEEARGEVASEVERRLIMAEIEKLQAAGKVVKPEVALDPALVKKTELID